MARGGKKRKLRKLTGGRTARRRRRQEQQGKNGRPGVGVRQLKKDPGVPNLQPFHTQRRQRETDRRTNRAAEVTERQKTARAKEVLKRRSLESLQADVERRQTAFEQRETSVPDPQCPRSENTASHSRTYCREFKQVIEVCDVILEVLDCRDPLGCRCPQVERSVFESGANKRLVLVLNKIDLVPKEVVEKWLKYLRNELPTVAFKASTQQQAHNLQMSDVSVEGASEELMRRGGSLGAQNLMKILGSYCRHQGLTTGVTVGVVGFPNVGKSSLINSLKRERVCQVGAKAGVTRSVQYIQVAQCIRVCDSPGLVLASGSQTSLVLRNCIPVEQVINPVEPVAAILRRCDIQQVSAHYGVPVSVCGCVEGFLCGLATRRGRVRPGGVPDQEAAARGLLTDWTSGKISWFCTPPPSPSLSPHLSSQIVAEMGKVFDPETLTTANQLLLNELDSPLIEVGMCLESEGLTEAATERETQGETQGGRENETETMEGDTHTESDQITVRFEARREKGGRESSRDPPSLPPLALCGVRNVSPLYQGQALAGANRRRRKLQKRADKLATKLSNTLTAAMDFL